MVATGPSGAVSQGNSLHNLRTGEVLPPARTNERRLKYWESEMISGESLQGVFELKTITLY